MLKEGKYDKRNGYIIRYLDNHPEERTELEKRIGKRLNSYVNDIKGMSNLEIINALTIYESENQKTKKELMILEQLSKWKEGEYDLLIDYLKNEYSFDDEKITEIFNDIIIYRKIENYKQYGTIDDMYDEIFKPLRRFESLLAKSSKVSKAYMSSFNLVQYEGKKFKKVLSLTEEEFNKDITKWVE